MSDNNNAYKGSTFWQLILVIPGSILAFTLIISLIAKMSGVEDVPAAVSETATVEVESNRNIKPVAEVVVAVVDASAGEHIEKSGEQVVKETCAMCHASGMMNAPKIGDNSAWAPRIAQGYDALVSNAVNGVRTMPAKGGNQSLTDAEVASAVTHMANASGASFK